jgi:phosphoglycolate phosphatase
MPQRVRHDRALAGGEVMQLKRPHAVLFDWDNTLVNTWPVIHAALEKTFIRLGREPWPIELVKQRVARSMRDSFPLVFGKDWEAAGELYQQNFRDIHLERLEPFAGSEATLAYLREQKPYVAVVSNKKGVNLRKEVEHLGWGKYFSQVVGAQDTPFDKPAKDPVHAALKGSGIEAGPDVWFVGDSVIDMECAGATGCYPVWYGELPPEKLEHPFQRRVESQKELLGLFREVFE